MNKKMLLPVLMSSFLLVTACGSHKKDKKKSEKMDVSAYSKPVPLKTVNKLTETWPESAKMAISNLSSKYGAPSAVTEDMVVWSYSGPFKRSVVFREEVNHQFPNQHSDVLMQTVDYRIPLDKVAALSKFDGSIIVDRTKGELSARNEREEMNILSLNLSDRIVRGEMTVEEARREYSKNAEAFSAGDTSSKLLSGLTFTTQGNTSDPDTMMQSQTEDQPSVRKTIQSEKVEEVIQEE